MQKIISDDEFTSALNMVEIKRRSLKYRGTKENKIQLKADIDELLLAINLYIENLMKTI